MKFPDIELLEEFKNNCNNELFSKKYKIDYSKATNDWINDNDTDDIYAKQLETINNSIFHGDKNIYAIYENDILVYIGKTKSNLAKERLKNHLFYKHKKTGSKLKYVKKAIQKNYTIDISSIYITPESLRNYIEEELIIQHKPSWNIQGK